MMKIEMGNIYASGLFLDHCISKYILIFDIDQANFFEQKPRCSKSKMSKCKIAQKILTSGLRLLDTVFPSTVSMMLFQLHAVSLVRHYVFDSAAYFILTGFLCSSHHMNHQQT